MLKFNVTVTAPTALIRLSALVHPSMFITSRSPEPETIGEPVKDMTRLSPEPLSPPTAGAITGSRSLGSDTRGPTANVPSTNLTRVLCTPEEHDVLPIDQESHAVSSFRRRLEEDRLFRRVGRSGTKHSGARFQRGIVGETVSVVKRVFIAITGRTASKSLSQISNACLDCFPSSLSILDCPRRRFR